jgi:uncharacterized protein YjcR
MAPAAPIATHRSLLERWPDFAQIALDLGVSIETVRSWHRRDVIAERHWEALAESARRAGVAGISYDSFRQVAAARRR